MKDLENIDSVIFDMDGVIFDTEKLYIDCSVEIGKNYGLTDVEEVCNKCIGITAEESEKIVRAAYGDDFPLEKYKLEVYELFKETLGDAKAYIKKGVRELLTYLKENGIKIALASSTYTEGVKRELTSAGLIDFFDTVIGGDVVSKSKPNPDIFLEAMRQLGSTKDKCLIIEDSFNGVRAAFNAGIRVIMVPDLLQPDDEMKEKADMIMQSLDEVREFLQSRK